MMHANKMILVPHDIGGRQDDGTASLMSNLDREMNRILQDNVLASDTKIILYSNILHRYRKAMEEQQKPFQLEIHESLPGVNTNTVMDKTPTSQILQTVDPPPIKENSELETRLMAVIPPKWQKNAKELFHYATHNPHIQWSEKGEMLFNNKKIVDSHIIDLISDFSRESKTRQPAVGAEIFLKSLLKENIPREIIINKARLGLNEKELVITPSTVSSYLNVDQSSSSTAASGDDSTPKKKSPAHSVLQSRWQSLFRENIKAK